MSTHDVLDERVAGGAPLLRVKLTPQMAARNRPFGRGSSMGAFGHKQTVVGISHFVEQVSQFVY